MMTPKSLRLLMWNGSCTGKMPVVTPEWEYNIGGGVDYTLRSIVLYSVLTARRFLGMKEGPVVSVGEDWWQKLLEERLCRIEHRCCWQLIVLGGIWTSNLLFQLCVLVIGLWVRRTSDTLQWVHIGIGLHGRMLSFVVGVLMLVGCCSCLLWIAWAEDQEGRWFVQES